MVLLGPFEEHMVAANQGLRIGLYVVVGRVILGFCFGSARFCFASRRFQVGSWEGHVKVLVRCCWASSSVQ